MAHGVARDRQSNPSARKISEYMLRVCLPTTNSCAPPMESASATTCVPQLTITSLMVFQLLFTNSDHDCFCHKSGSCFSTRVFLRPGWKQSCVFLSSWTTSCVNKSQRSARHQVCDELRRANHMAALFIWRRTRWEDLVFRRVSDLQSEQRVGLTPSVWPPTRTAPPTTLTVSFLHVSMVGSDPPREILHREQHLCLHAQVSLVERVLLFALQFDSPFHD